MFALLQTGQPGYAPEEAIRDYDINDYKSQERTDTYPPAYDDYGCHSILCLHPALAEGRKDLETHRRCFS